MTANYSPVQCCPAYLILCLNVASGTAYTLEILQSVHCGEVNCRTAHLILNDKLRTPGEDELHRFGQRISANSVQRRPMLATNERKVGIVLVDQITKDFFFFFFSF
jgi:hypothetical protein